MGSDSTVMTMRKFALNLAVLAAFLFFGELFIRPLAAAAFFITSERVPLSLAPFWIAVPNLLWYGLIGALLAWRFRSRPAIAIGAIFALACVLMWRFQYPAGIWISDDAYAYIVALAPMMALPIGMLLGYLVVRKTLRPSLSAERPT